MDFTGYRKSASTSPILMGGLFKLSRAYAGTALSTRERH